MRILCFFPIFRPAKAELVYDGGERQFIEICKRWIKLGNEVHIIESNYARRLCEKYGLKVFTYTFEPTRFNLGELKDFLNIRKMIKMIPKQDFDFIYCPGEPFPYVIASVIAKKKLGIPLIGSINLFHPDDVSIFSSFRQTLAYTETRAGIAYFKDLPKRFFFTLKKCNRNFLIKKMSAIFTVSSYIKKLLVKMGVDEERIYPVAASVDFDYIQSISAKEKYFDGCFLGAIIPRKGALDLIKAWIKVVRKRPDAKLVVIGGGSEPYTRKVKELIEKYNLWKNVTVTGFVSEEEKFNLLKRGKIFIFPSYLEGNPLVVREAMACGLPVIAYDLPVYEEWYSDSIVYVKTGDENELAKATLALLDDPLLQRELGDKGLKIVRRYEWGSIADYELKIITKILEC